MRRLPAVLAVALLMAPPLAAQWPPEVSNLQVIPEDIEFRELVGMMADFTRALGVRCSYCHVGEEGAPLASYDFASDEKLTKRKARQMLRMVRAINQEYLAGLEARQEHPVPVECATCHSGITTPRQLKDVVLLAYDAGGVDSAIAEYTALRQRYHGRAAYDFGVVPLVDVANEVQARGSVGDAVAIHALNVEHHADSPFATRSYAGLALGHAFVEDGVEAGRARYRALVEDLGASALPEFTLNRLGYQLLGRGLHDAAIAVFTLNVEANPESANVYDSLGEGLMEAGRLEEAVANYERSLALDPDNTNAREKLEELRRRLGN